MFSEVILFALDFQVSQATRGEPLWRMHDDFWFWSVKESSCEAAWRTITSFSTTMGLSLNPMRTGCSRIRQNKKQSAPTYNSLEPSKGLPSAQIRWGMLLLNPQTGKFEIDNTIVDKHIEELSRQLKDKSGSVFAWIQAWNTYATTFFTSNFGKPANCFGREHIDSMLSTHGRIQRKIFSSLMGTSAQSSSGGVVEFLKQIIALRFGVTDIPDGYFFFPLELGGLDLQSPFVTLLQLRDTVVQNTAERLDAFELAERAEFTQAKEKYLRDEVSPASPSTDAHFKPDYSEEFLSFEEFTRFREDINSSYSAPSLYDVYCQLLSRPFPQPINSESKGPIVMALSGLQDRQILHRFLPQWNTMEPYWKWVFQLYGPEMIEHFGGLRIVDPGLLPIGMVGLFRRERVSWQE